MDWYSPWAFLLLVLLPFMGWLLLRRGRTAAVRFSTLADVKQCPVSWRLRLRPLLIASRLLCLALLIVALARPRKGTVISDISTEGVAIEAVVDRSGSMHAKMNYRGEELERLEVVKRVLHDFIAGGEDLPGRPGDLIGLVTFARYADTVCPLVLGHNILTDFLRQTEIVSVRHEDGTAIGDAIALAAARLRKAEEEIHRRNVEMGLAGEEETPGFKIKSRAIILLTDGRNNVGRYSPLEAAELAKEWGIKIYTIGIGSGRAYNVMRTPLGAVRVPARDELDEELLKKIADRTGGIYGRADDAEALREIVGKIDELEKTKVRSVQYTEFAERFGWFAWPALALLGFEVLAGCTIWRKVP
jgi:Ca-activated chloride channel family protein